MMQAYGIDDDLKMKYLAFEAPEVTDPNEPFTSPGSDYNPNSQSESCQLECQEGYPCRPNRYIIPPSWLMMVAGDNVHEVWDAKGNNAGVLISGNEECPTCQEVLDTPESLRWTAWDSKGNPECQRCGPDSATRDTPRVGGGKPIHHPIYEGPAWVKKKRLPKYVKPIVYRCPTLYDMMKMAFPDFSAQSISAGLHTEWDDRNRKWAKDGGCSFEGNAADYCGDKGRDKVYAFGRLEANGKVAEDAFLGLYNRLKDTTVVTHQVSGIDIPCSQRPFILFTPAQHCLKKDLNEDEFRTMMDKIEDDISKNPQSALHAQMVLDSDKPAALNTTSTDTRSA